MSGAARPPEGDARVPLGGTGRQAEGAALSGAARPPEGDARVPPGWRGSLQLRLLAGTLLALLAALALAGVLLAGLFRDHVLRQFQSGLTAQLDQLTARLDFDAAGQPQLPPSALTDPRWSRPYGGLYWQVDSVAAQRVQRGVLRSRSLWDLVLRVDADELPDGVVHVHQLPGPLGHALLLVERTVRHADGPAATDATPWRLLVAGDLHDTQAAVARFNQVLAASLAALLGLLGLAAVAQVTVGLRPLRTLRRALVDLRAGRTARLDGRFPAEVQPLIDDFNAVLARNAEVVGRARTQAGNLAHAIKTPLAVMAQGAQAAAASPASAELAALVQEQVAVARRHVDWHLARARAAAAQGLPGARVPLAPVVAALLRVMDRIHGARGLRLDGAAIDPACSFAGELQDLQEMLGNVLDNACQWARHSVRLSATLQPAGAKPMLLLVVDDDGPGIGREQRDAVLARGARLDESTPGSGLGLAIVRELVELYGGRLQLGASPSQGLRVQLLLPAGPA